MPVALCCMSHSPLLEFSPLPDGVERAVDGAFARARSFVADFDPDLVVLFAPDHYNGFFYKLMPPFAVGLAASSVGDFGSAVGDLPVPTDLARDLAQSVLYDGLDLSVSLRMEVDHGAVQPLEVLWGGIAERPVIPFFINSVAPPFGPMSRVRLLGEAVGRWAERLDMRVLLLGSGGLSHDPPAPQLGVASDQVRERMIAGGARPLEGEHARGAWLAGLAKDFAEGSTTVMQPLNAEWDNRFLDHLERGEIAAVDRWSPEYITEQGGHSAHEVRTWLAAYAALSAAGSYEMRYRFYREIPELIAGFAVTTALPR